MKKIMMTLVAVAMATTMNAQVYLGGTLGFKSMSSDGTSATEFSVKPEVGYNLSDKFAVGMSIGYATSNMAYNNGVFAGKLEKRTNTFTVSPYVRYTFAKLDKVNFFCDGLVEYSNLDNGAFKTNAFAIGFQPGVAVNVNEKISFVAKLGQLTYATAKADYDGAKAVNEFNFNLSSLAALNFGLYYNF